MNYETKFKINNFIEKNKKKILAIGISTIIFAIVGLVLFVIGSLLTGFNPFKWLISKQAQALYVLFILIGLNLTILILYARYGKD